MKTILQLAIMALALGLLAIVVGRCRVEGVVRLPGKTTTFTAAQFGPVAVGLATYRPGRAYYKLAVGR